VLSLCLLKLSTLALAFLILNPKSLFAIQPLHFHSPPPALQSHLVTKKLLHVLSNLGFVSVLNCCFFQCTVEEGTGRLKEGKDSTTHLETWVHFDFVIFVNFV